MAHPPMPGPPVQPNFLAVMEAISEVTFPISKRDLLDQVGDATVLMKGENRSLHDLIKDIHDDAFESDEEFLAALEHHYTMPDDGLESERADLSGSGEDPLRRTERAGPIEHGAEAMVRSDVHAQDE